MTDSFIQPPTLPDSKDQLFATSEDWWDHACLNFGGNRWSTYAIGYKEAADILVNSIKANDRQQDVLVYPIVFLYRQYVELALKDLICQAGRLLSNFASFPKVHRIDKLWELCNQLLAGISLSDSEYRREIGRLIDEFAKVDPLSMAFRYPEDKVGNPSLSGLTHINLQNVRDVVEKISVYLDGADAQIDEYTSFPNLPKASSQFADQKHDENS